MKPEFSQSHELQINPEIAQQVENLTEKASEAAERYFTLNPGAVARTTRKVSEASAEYAQKYEKYGRIPQEKAKLMETKDKLMGKILELAEKEISEASATNKTFANVRPPIPEYGFVTKYSNEPLTQPEDIANPQGRPVARLHPGDFRLEKITMSPEFTEVKTKNCCIYTFGHTPTINVAIKPNTVDIPVTYFSLSAEPELYRYRLAKRVLTGDGSEDKIPEGADTPLSKKLGCEGCYDAADRLKYIIIHYRDTQNKHCLETHGIIEDTAELLEQNDAAKTFGQPPKVAITETEAIITRETPAQETIVRKVPLKADFEGWSHEIFKQIDVVDS